MKRLASKGKWKKHLQSNRPTVALFEPKIPQNTGNIVRTCAAFGANLILIEPLGFRYSPRLLKRSALDHLDKVNIERLDGVEALLEKERPIYLLSAHAKKPVSEIPFGTDDIYLFGSETDGLPKELMERYKERCYRIPQREEVRCINLANSVAIVLYNSYVR